jgi:hypothetical protein
MDSNRQFRDASPTADGRGRLDLAMSSGPSIRRNSSIGFPPRPMTARMIEPRPPSIGSQLGRGLETAAYLARSNPFPSSKESANFRFLSGGQVGVRTKVLMRNRGEVPVRC